ncbi:MAG: MFS transporter [Candidatus Geothermarchaeales archaeon]
MSVYKNTNLRVIFGLTLTSAMSINLIAPALPKMATALDIPEVHVGLMISFFTLPGVFLVPLIGILADRYGRKKVLMPCLIAHGVFGSAVAFTNNFQHALVLRVLQGIGWAGLFSLITTLIGDLFEDLQRSEAIGANASILGIGLASFPLIGGAIAISSWSNPFLLFSVAFPMAALAHLFLDEPTVEKRSETGGDFRSAFKYVKSLRATAVLAAAILAYILLFGTFVTYFTLLLEEKFQASPLTTGVLIAVMFLVSSGVSTQAGRVVKRLAKSNAVIVGFFVYGLSLLIIPFISQPQLFLLPVAALGVGHGLNIPALHTLATELAPIEHRAVVVSLFITMIRVGQTLGPPLLATILLYSDLNMIFVVSGLAAISSVAIGSGLKSWGKFIG